MLPGQEARMQNVSPARKGWVTSMKDPERRRRGTRLEKVIAAPSFHTTI
jgi:hypothetical protein